MDAQRRPEQAGRGRPLYRVVAEPVGGSAWHLTVVELPATWTVAFDRSEVESRARRRIAIDLGVHSDDFDVAITWRGDDLH